MGTRPSTDPAVATVGLFLKEAACQRAHELLMLESQQAHQMGMLNAALSAIEKAAPAFLPLVERTSELFGSLEAERIRAQIKRSDAETAAAVDQTRAETEETRASTARDQAEWNAKLVQSEARVSPEELITGLREETAEGVWTFQKKPRSKKGGQ